MPDFSDGSAPDIQLKLYRKAGENGATEGVTYQQNGGQPTWGKTEDPLVWAYTYTNLPKCDQKGVEYIYWALEEAGSAEGFYPVYPMAIRAVRSRTPPRASRLTRCARTPMTARC